MNKLSNNILAALYGWYGYKYCDKLCSISISCLKRPFNIQQLFLLVSDARLTPFLWDGQLSKHHNEYTYITWCITRHCILFWVPANTTLIHRDVYTEHRVQFLTQLCNLWGQWEFHHTFKMSSSINSLAIDMEILNLKRFATAIAAALWVARSVCRSARHLVQNERFQQVQHREKQVWCTIVS